MANLVRLKQLDKPELSGYILSVTDENYYPSNNPSGYISDISSDSDFIALSGNLNTTGSNLLSGINSSGAALSGLIISSGSFLDLRIDTLSGNLNTTNANVSTVSGNAQYAINLITGYEVEVSGVISGEVSGLTDLITGTSGVLNTKINNLSIDNYSFVASGLGTITGDVFVTKLMQQNNVECIISSIIYTGSY